MPVATYSVTLTITDGCGYHASLCMPMPLRSTHRRFAGGDCGRPSQVQRPPSIPAKRSSFGADVSPDDAKSDIASRLIVDGTLGFRLTSGKDPLTFHHTPFSNPGTHTIEIAV